MRRFYKTSRVKFRDLWKSGNTAIKFEATIDNGRFLQERRDISHQVIKLSLQPKNIPEKLNFSFGDRGFPINLDCQSFCESVHMGVTFIWIIWMGKVGKALSFVRDTLPTDPSPPPPSAATDKRLMTTSARPWLFCP